MLLIQARQFLAVNILAIVLTVRRTYRFLMCGAAMVAAFVISNLLFSFFSMGELVEKYSKMLFSKEDNNANVRMRTIGIILDKMQESLYLGQGALSLLWEGGFTPFYGNTFFLADVGTFGSLFRFGWLLAPLLFILFYTMHVQFREVKQTYIRQVLYQGLLVCLILLPLSAPLEYRGNFVALLLVLALAARHQQGTRIAEPPAQMERTAEEAVEETGPARQVT